MALRCPRPRISGRFLSSLRPNIRCRGADGVARHPYQVERLSTKRISRLCSARGALGKVVGDAAATVDPEQVESLKLQLARLVPAEGLRGRLRAAGLERARQFNWQHTAAQTLEVYARAAGKVNYHNAKLALVGQLSDPSGAD